MGNVNTLTAANRHADQLQLREAQERRGRMDEITKQSQWLLGQVEPDMRLYVQDVIVKHLVDTLAYFNSDTKRFDETAYALALNEWRIRAAVATNTQSTTTVKGVTLYYAPRGEISGNGRRFDTTQLATEAAALNEVESGLRIPLIPYIEPDGTVFLLDGRQKLSPPQLGVNPLDYAIWVIVPDEPLRRHEVPPDYEPPPVFQPEE